MEQPADLSICQPGAETPTRCSSQHQQQLSYLHSDLGKKRPNIMGIMG